MPRTPFVRVLLVSLAMLSVSSLAALSHGRAAAEPRAAIWPSETLAYTPVTVSDGPVTLERDTVTLPVDGAYRFRVRTTVVTSTPYLEVRLRIFRPSGGLLIQKTEIAADVPPGSTVTTFSRDLDDLDLRQGRYRVQIRVRMESRSGDVAERIIEDRLLLYESGAPKVPLAIVVRLGCSPGLDPQGSFVQDPATETYSRDAAMGLAGLIGRRQDLRISLAAPPVLLDEWGRAAAGYTVSGPGGVRRVPKEAPVALSYARAIDSLRTAVRSGRVELLDVPYGDPDLSGLEAMSAMADLAAHYALGRSTYMRTLEATPSGGTALCDERVPRKALATLREAAVRYATIDPATLPEQDDARAPSGAYRVRGGVITALLVDRTASEALASGDSTKTPLIDRVFARLDSDDATKPLVAVVTLGPGREATVDGIVGATAVLADVPWVRTITALEAVRMRQPRMIELPRDLGLRAGTPTGYWEDVAQAGRYSKALASALATDDPDAEDALWAAMTAESGCWAGPDASWSMADRGRAFAAAAVRHARRFLDAVTVDAKDITLSGQGGEVPVSVVNASPKELRVTLRASAERLHFPTGADRRVLLETSENFVTLPVDLRSALSDKLDVAIWVGDIELDRATVTVRASYLDKLAIVGGIAVLLASMLFFIRRRVLTAEEAGTSSRGGAHALGSARSRAGSAGSQGRSHPEPEDASEDDRRSDDTRSDDTASIEP